MSFPTPFQSEGIGTHEGALPKDYAQSPRLCVSDAEVGIERHQVRLNLVPGELDASSG